jgi:predicted GIY-YIG superfamily endonuclease
LPFSHPAEPVLPNFDALIHAPNHTRSDAARYTEVMAINGGVAVPPELAVNVERYAVYRCYGDDGQLLYVGETGDLGTRFASHAQKLWFTQVRGITLEWYLDELDALNAERRAIHVEHPKYNVVHRSAPLLEPRRPPASRAPQRKPVTRGSSGRTVLTLEERAARLLDEDPELREPRMGGEIARRLGVSPATGRRLRAKLATRTG